MKMNMRWNYLTGTQEGNAKKERKRRTHTNTPGPERADPEKAREKKNGGERRRTETGQDQRRGGEDGRA